MSIEDALHEVRAAYADAGERVSEYPFNPGYVAGAGVLVLGETSLSVVLTGRAELYPYDNVGGCHAASTSWAFFPIHGANQHLSGVDGWRIQGDLVARLSRFHQRR